MITKENLKEVLTCLEFKEKEQIFTRIFNNEAKIEVDFKKEKITYPKELKIESNTTSNFSQNENFVVLECVCRLLECGYAAKDLTLEKTWILGHSGKSGRADITIEKESKVYCIIECKSAGKEFLDAKKDLEFNEEGTQLFSYAAQARSVEYLALYTSDFKDKRLQPQEYTIMFKDDANILALNDDNVLLYKNASDTKDFYRVFNETYNKQSFSNILFSSKPYQIGTKPLYKKDLIEFDKHDGINVKFKEILRHNNISDKENAFNKLLSLFLCKCVDERSKKDDEELDFQYKRFSDDYFTLYERILNLFIKGMQEFLKEEVYKTKDNFVANTIKAYTNKAQRKKMQEVLEKELLKAMLFSSNAFSFKETHNEILFKQNGKILVEVVELLSPYRISHSSKTQFLGEIFEQFLNEGFKEDEGRYFTPVPIARFIWNSLPFEDFINLNQTKNAFPKVIDFACGSGHFLTEGISALSDHAKENNANISDEEISKNFYGIDKDNRLSRTTQVALLLNGANSAKIRAIDGLEYNLEFYGDNQQSFDILVSNPPYSVKDFKQHLSKNITNARDKFIPFKVLESLSLNSKNIENVFVERLTHILKPNALAAIILPSSILTNTDLSTIITREILLENFALYAIVSFGNQTFGTTGTNTIVLFLKRFDEPPKRTELLEDSLEAILKNDDLKDFEDEEIFNAYLALQNLDKELYKSFLAKDSSCLESEYFKSYLDEFTKLNFSKLQPQEQAKFFDLTTAKEKEKLKFFALTYKQTTLIIKAPSENNEQKKFLGYTISQAKNKKSGLAEGEGLLSHKTDRNAKDKIAHAIKSNFKNEQIDNENLNPYLTYTKAAYLLNFSTPMFNKAINLNPAKILKGENLEQNSTQTNPFLNSKYELVKLGEILKSLGKGKRPASFENKEGKINFYKSSLEIYKCDEYDFDTEALIMGDGGSANIHYEKGKFASTDHTYIFTNLNNNVSLRYVYFLIRNNLGILEAGFKGIALKNIAKKFIENEVKIPLPPLEIQKQIVAECEEVEKQFNTIKMSLDEYNKLIKAILVKCGICSDGGGDLSLILALLKELVSLENSVLKFSDSAPNSKQTTDSNQDLKALNLTQNLQDSSLNNDFKDLNLSQDLNLTQNLQALNSNQDLKEKDFNKALKELSLKELENLLKTLPTPPTQGWERVRLGEVLTLEYGKALQEFKRIKGEYPVMGSNGIVGYHNEFIAKAPCIIVGRKGSAGKITYIEKDCYPIDTTFYVKTKTQMVMKILYFILQSLELEKNKLGVSVPGINRNDLYALKIPLPPLKEQEKIVQCIEFIESKIKVLNLKLQNLETKKAQILSQALGL